MADHDLSILDSVSPTVSSEAEKSETYVSAPVDSPIYLARLFDEDKLNKRMAGNHHRFELILDADEMKSIDLFAKEFDAGRSGVLRVGLRNLLRVFPLLETES